MIDNLNNSNKKNSVMLTTLDNPYNPFTQFDDWFTFDTENGYDTCNYLARVAKLADDLSDEDEALAIEQAIDEIIDMNITGLYIKVTPDNFKDRSNMVAEE